MDNYNDYKKYISATKCKCGCKEHCGHSCQDCEYCPDCECEKCKTTSDSKGQN